MSASLVGSEMCIRDRLWRVPPSSLLQSRGSGRRQSPGIGQPLRDNNSVSYTHLTLPTICSV
eukprot:4805204-Alexandrium_andersonii.AAC.1